MSDTPTPATAAPTTQPRCPFCAGEVRADAPLNAGLCRLLVYSRGLPAELIHDIRGRFASVRGALGVLAHADFNTGEPDKRVLQQQLVEQAQKALGQADHMLNRLRRLDAWQYRSHDPCALDGLSDIHDDIASECRVRWSVDLGAFAGQEGEIDGGGYHCLLTAIYHEILSRVRRSGRSDVRIGYTLAGRAVAGEAVVTADWLAEPDPDRPNLLGWVAAVHHAAIDLDRHEGSVVVRWSFPLL